MILKKTANYWVPLVILLVLVGMSFLNLKADQSTHFEDHFAPRWNTAGNWIRQGLSPYSDETQRSTLSLLKTNNSTADELSKGKFLDPAWYVLFYIPISFVPYPIAKAIWMTLLEVSVAVSIFLGLQLSGLKLNGIETAITILLGTVFYPFVRDYLTANMMPFYVMLTLLGVRLALKKQGAHAGLLFLLAIWMNPAMIFVAVFLLILLGGQRDGSMARMLMIGFAFLMAVSLILFPGWVRQWFADIVLLNPSPDMLNTPWMRAASFVPGAERQISIILHLATLVMLLVEWYGLSRRGERGVQWKLILTLTVAYFFNLYSDGSALLLVLPGFFAISKYLTEKWKVSGKIIHWLAFMAIGFSSWRLGSNPLQGIPKAHDLTLLLVPFLIFIGLQWFRWWAIASPKALVESNKNSG